MFFLWPERPDNFHFLLNELLTPLLPIEILLVLFYHRGLSKKRQTGLNSACLYKKMLVKCKSSSVLYGVVRSFFRDLDVMRMAFAEPCASNPYELGVFAKFLEIFRSAVSHAGAKAADQLMDRILQRAFVRYASFDAFRYELLIVVLEVAVLAALLHSGHGAHAAVYFVAASLINFRLSRAFFRA